MNNKKKKSCLAILLIICFIIVLLPGAVYAKSKCSLGKISIKVMGESVFFTVKGSKNVGAYCVEYSQRKDFKNSEFVTTGVGMPFCYFGDDGKDTLYIENLKPGKKYYVRILGMTALCGDISETPWSKTYVVKAKKCNTIKKGEYATCVNEESKKNTEVYWDTKLSVSNKMYIINDKLFINGALCKYNSSTKKSSSFGKKGVRTYKLDKKCKIYMYNYIDKRNVYVDADWINSNGYHMAYTIKSNGKKITSIKIWYSE